MKPLIFLFLFTISVKAQVKGVVLDSITKQPIAYAAVAIENTTTGVNTEPDGSFELPETGTHKNLIVSLLGYQTKKVSISNCKTIFLAPTVNSIETVVIQSKLATSEITVGELKKSNYGFGNGGFASIYAKKIVSNPEIEKHPFIKDFTFITRSSIKNAKINVIFYEIDDNGNASNCYLEQEITVTVKKGKHKNTVNVSEYNIKIPSNGLFIGFRTLIIEANKYKYNYTKEGEKNSFKGVLYEPSIQGFKSENANVWMLSNNKTKLMDFSNSKHYKKPIELAIKLTLTN